MFESLSFRFNICGADHARMNFSIAPIASRRNYHLIPSSIFRASPTTPVSPFARRSHPC